MKIEIDNTYAEKIRKLIISDYEQRRKEKEIKRQRKWHVSDLIFPRFTYFKEIYGWTPNHEDIGYFFTGEAYHRELQRILGVKYAEVIRELHGIVATIDHFDTVLIEIKTSRKWSLPNDPEPHYVRQDGYYCAITKQKESKIVVIYPTSGREYKGKKSSTVEIRAWEVTFTDKDLAAIEFDMLETVRQLEAAIRRGDPSSLPPCPAWKCRSFVRGKSRKERIKMLGNYSYVTDKSNPFYYVRRRDELDARSIGTRLKYEAAA